MPEQTLTVPKDIDDLTKEELDALYAESNQQLELMTSTSSQGARRFSAGSGTAPR